MLQGKWKLDCFLFATTHPRELLLVVHADWGEPEHVDTAIYICQP